MEKNLYIDASHPNETRVVLKSNDDIEDYEYEGSKNNLIKNNVYLGKVSRIEPSLQAAFVDFGRTRHGFLAFNDIQTDYYMSKVVDILYEKDMMLGNQMSDSVHPMTWNVNSHPVWESLMWNSLSEVERCTDEKLFPTYSFQRVYLKDAHMSHHSDWPWCQISITVNLGQSHPYPLFVTDLETNESVKFQMTRRT